MKTLDEKLNKKKYIFQDDSEEEQINISDWLVIQPVSYTHLDVYKRQGLGRYDLQGKQTPTAYFLGKINIARHLEPAIPTECLVRLLAYHYGGEITRGRINGRIQTIEEMSTLLAEMEQELSLIHI